MNHPAFIKVDKATFYRFIRTAPDNVRYEFVRGRIVQQQAGGTLRHGRVAARILELLRDAQDRSSWEVLSERGVETSHTVRFGDVVVEPTGGDPDGMATRSPVVIVEVLSPTSGDRDLNEKPEEYLSLPTLQAYVIASQTEAACLVWSRGNDGTFPAEPRIVQGEGASIEVPALSLAMPVGDIYRGIL